MAVALKTRFAFRFQGNRYERRRRAASEARLYHVTTQRADRIRNLAGAESEDRRRTALRRDTPPIYATDWLAQFGEAREVLARLPTGMRGWIAPGFDKHPLCGLAA